MRLACILTLLVALLLPRVGTGLQCSHVVVTCEFDRPRIQSTIGAVSQRDRFQPLKVRLDAATPSSDGRFNHVQWWERLVNRFSHVERTNAHTRSAFDIKLSVPYALRHEAEGSPRSSMMLSRIMNLFVREVLPDDHFRFTTLGFDSLTSSQSMSLQGMPAVLKADSEGSSGVRSHPLSSLFHWARLVVAPSTSPPDSLPQKPSCPPVSVETRPGGPPHHVIMDRSRSLLWERGKAMWSALTGGPQTSTTSDIAGREGSSTDPVTPHTGPADCHATVPTSIPPPSPLEEEDHEDWRKLSFMTFLDSSSAEANSTVTWSAANTHRDFLSTLATWLPSSVPANTSTVAEPDTLVDALKGDPDGDLHSQDPADHRALLSIALPVATITSPIPALQAAVTAAAGTLPSQDLLVSSPHGLTASTLLPPPPAASHWQKSAHDASLPAITKADFAQILSMQTRMAVKAALSLKTEKDCQEYLHHFNMNLLLSYVISKDHHNDKADAIHGLCKLVRLHPHLANELGRQEPVTSALCEYLDVPTRRFGFLAGPDSKEKEYLSRLQRESLALLLRLVRSSDSAAEHLKRSARLKKLLAAIATADVTPFTPAGLRLNASVASSTQALHRHRDDLHDPHGHPHERGSHRRNKTVIVDYAHLRLGQMARVALCGLGGGVWKPRQPGQRGLRILSLDGGGTRGVLSIAFLKELFQRVNAEGRGRAGMQLQPFDCFDMICGTSTGGIIAMLLGAQCRSIQDGEALYDDFIDKIFATRSNLKLVTEQAAYDEKQLEEILFTMTGNSLLLDANVLDCPRVFCVSTKVNSNPPQAQIWRTYDYPAGQASRYAGTCRANTMTAIRATTAAPTFFTPVPWEGGLFVDGALVANNPTAIALQEAKAAFPDVPVELVVSLGTGVFSDTTPGLKHMGWDLLVNQLIASTTDTEDVHGLLVDFLPKDSYFRFNPIMKENFAIDEKQKHMLSSLKTLAKMHFAELEQRDPAHIDTLVKLLRGKAK